ncbi:MAG: RNA polymerase sigma factor [Friedmanniella sp.]
MALSSEDQAFVAFAESSSRVLAGCALLMTGEPKGARRLAQTVLARRYPPHGTPDELLTAALRELVRPQPSLFRPPWLHEAGLELVDTDAAHPPAPLLGELQRLLPEQRASLVFSLYAQLEPAEVAAVLGTDVSTVQQWVGQAHQLLAARRPERLQPRRLAEELRKSADGHLDEGEVSAARSDLEHGQQLRRSRRVRRASAVAAAVLVVLVGAVALLGGRTVTPEAASSPPPAARSAPAPVPHVSATCDVRNGICQATVMREWRGEMSRIAASYVDPQGVYFTGYSFSYTPRYESTAFWARRGGALGLDMFRLRGGATEVYLQVASDYRTAVRCGQITGRPCQSQRFLDGNRFTLTMSTDVAQGIEVQYRPDGDQVITVVARNTTRGASLKVTRAQLIALVQDPRLRLPEI